MGRPGAARGSFIDHKQLAFFGCHTDHGKRAAFAFAQGFEEVERFRRNRQHVALLALVAPDFFWRHATFVQLDGAQIKAGSTPGVIRQLGEGIAQTACADIVNRQNRVAGAVGATHIT